MAEDKPAEMSRWFWIAESGCGMGKSWMQKSTTTTLICGKTGQNSFFFTCKMKIIQKSHAFGLKEKKFYFKCFLSKKGQAITDLEDFTGKK